MFASFRDARRRMSMARLLIVFMFAVFVFAAPASAGDVFGIPSDPPPPFGPKDFTDAEFEPTVAPGPDDLTAADLGGVDPGDAFETPSDTTGESFDGFDDAVVPVGLVASLPSTGTGPSDESDDRDLTPMFALAAAGCLIATGLLRSDRDSRWGKR